MLLCDIFSLIKILNFIFYKVLIMNHFLPLFLLLKVFYTYFVHILATFMFIVSFYFSPSDISGVDLGYVKSQSYWPTSFLHKIHNTYQYCVVTKLGNGKFLLTISIFAFYFFKKIFSTLKYSEPIYMIFCEIIVIRIDFKLRLLWNKTWN